MSYIHEALKKAQREKEFLASKCAAIWPRKPNRPFFLGRERFISACIIILAVGFSGYTWVQSIDSLPEGTKNEPSVYRGAINAPPALPSALPHRPTKKSPGPNLGASQFPAASVPKKTAPSNNLSAGGEIQAAPVKEGAPLGKRPFAGDGKSLYRDAVALQKKGKFQEAVYLYKRALKQSPDLVSALNNLGAIYIQQNNFVEARKVLEKAIRTDTNYVDPYYNLACLHAQQKDIGRSLFYLKKAVSVDKSARLWAKTDEDLKNLRGHVEYENIIRGA
jgi:tetratricopeptide (TPR) repeat protein